MKLTYTTDISTPTPHDPATPAVPDMDEFPERVSPRLPSWNEGSEDKHWMVRSELLAYDFYIFH